MFLSWFRFFIIICCWWSVVQYSSSAVCVFTLVYLFHWIIFFVILHFADNCFSAARVLIANHDAAAKSLMCTVNTRRQVGTRISKRWEASWVTSFASKATVDWEHREFKWKEVQAPAEENNPLKCSSSCRSSMNVQGTVKL